MKRAFGCVVLTWAILLLPVIIVAQGRVSGEDDPALNTDRSGNLQKQLELLRNRKAILEKRLTTLSPVSTDYALTADWIRELVEVIEYLQQMGPNDQGQTAQSNLIAVSGIATIPPSSSAPNLDYSIPQAFAEPAFKLSRPVEGATNEITELTLAWTEDHPC